ncbi:MAG: hypothetical protein JWN44_1394 [Myxococcales bacterium]|nr:hypothetical protein [Myxococcales bacterium]
MRFPHDRLDAYAAAADFVVAADKIALSLPPGRGYIVNQLRRASSSIQSNLAEGAGEFSAPDKARFYRFALRSATECAAHLDQCRNLELCDARVVEAAKELLDRVIAMTTGLVKRWSRESGGGRGNRER